jgi:two-component system response regulator AtoC
VQPQSHSSKGSHPRLLICDDDELFHSTVKYALRGQFDCESARHTDEAIHLMKRTVFDIILLDVQMRTSDEGLKAIPKIIEIDPSAAIVMTTGINDLNTVKEAMRFGASDYVVKDFKPDELLIAISRALNKRALLQRKSQQNFEMGSEQKKKVWIGTGAKSEALRKTIAKAALSNANVLIEGETGTGKEVVARLLRKTLSDGSLEPFVAVDSSTIQSSTAESILFGHEKGAFTGADRMRKGVFEEADGGIVYFDEIANMPLEIQAKLLRVIQEKEVVRLGSAQTRALSFRVVCATNRDLEAMAKKGEFKEDLLQRINALPLRTPSLKERSEDIPELVSHFCEKDEAVRGRFRFSDAAIETLRCYSWPGNVRELSNLVAYLGAMVEGNEVDIADLPRKITDLSPSVMKATELELGSGFYATVADFERSILNQAYSKQNGNISQLALTLRMDRSHLYSKLKQYGIHPKAK